MENKKEFVNIYLKSGNEFYEKSKEPKEGFEEITLKSGGKTYHKTHSYVKGTLLKVVKKESDYGDSIDLFLDTQDFVFVLSLKIWDVSKSINSWILELLKYLPTLKIGKEYKFTTNKTNRNNKGYLYNNLYINEIVNGELVKIDWVTYPDMPKGKKREATGKWDYADRDDYAFVKLTEAIDKLKSSSVREHTKDYPSKEPIIIEKGKKELPF